MGYQPQISSLVYKFFLIEMSQDYQCLYTGPMSGRFFHLTPNQYISLPAYLFARKTFPIFQRSPQSWVQPECYPQYEFQVKTLAQFHSLSQCNVGYTEVPALLCWIFFFNKQRCVGTFLQHTDFFKSNIRQILGYSCSKTSGRIKSCIHSVHIAYYHELILALNLNPDPKT